MRGKEWTEARLERLRRLWSEGLTFGQIGKEMGESRSCIAGKCDRLGLERGNNHKLTDATRAEITRLYRTRAYSIDDLAPMFGVSASPIWVALRKQKIRMNAQCKRVPKRAKRLAQSPSVHGAPG